MEDWQLDGPTPYPRHGQAVWKLAGGDLTYAELDIHTLLHDPEPEAWIDRYQARGWL
jgi:hypothetical protein